MISAHCVSCKDLHLCCPNASAKDICTAIPLDANGDLYLCERCALLYSQSKNGLKDFYLKMDEEFEGFRRKNREALCKLQEREFMAKNALTPEETALVDAIRQMDSCRILKEEAMNGIDTFFRADRRRQVYQCHQHLCKIKNLAAALSLQYD